MAKKLLKSRRGQSRSESEMDDFTLSLSGGFPAQDVIVGGDYSLAGDLSPDISHFFGHEEIIFEDIDSGLTSSSDDLNPPSLTSSSHHEDDPDIINIKEETSDEDSDTL